MNSEYGLFVEKFQNFKVHGSHLEICKQMDRYYTLLNMCFNIEPEGDPNRFMLKSGKLKILIFCNLRQSSMISFFL